MRTRPRIPAATPLQRIGEDRAKIGTDPATGATRAWKADAGFERNRRREFEEQDAPEVALGLLSQHLDRQPPLPSCAAGPLGRRDRRFGLHNTFEKFGEETLIPNTSAWTGGAYTFEQADYGRWNLSAGRTLRLSQAQRRCRR